MINVLLSNVEHLWLYLSGMAPNFTYLEFSKLSYFDA